MLSLLVVICIVLSSLVIHELCNYQSFVDLLHYKLSSAYRNFYSNLCK